MDQCRHYLNEVFEAAPQNNFQTRGNFQKIKVSFSKTNTGKVVELLHRLMLVHPQGAKPQMHVR